MTTDAAAGRQAARGTTGGPPVVLFVPGIEESPSNTGQRVAELMALDLSRGPGTYTVEHGPTSADGTKMADHWRIVDEAGQPVLDLSTVDYRPLLRKNTGSGDGVKATLRQLVTALRCLGMTVPLLLSARKRAKSGLARAQLGVGILAAVVLLVVLGLTVWTGGAALGRWNIPKLPESAENVAAMGLVAMLTWALVKSRPRLEAATETIRQFLDYAHDANLVKGATNALRSALDPLVHANGPRNVHVVGYSFGSLVALDLLFPKTATRPTPDPRYEASIASLITIGCPVDFMRLYFPDYPGSRTARMDGLRWVNIFNPADVFGSNFLEDDDFSGTDESDATPAAFPGCECVPTSIRYTDERLSLRSVLFRARGFASHCQYWRDADRGDCLNLVTDVVLSPTPQVPAPRRPLG